MDKRKIKTSKMSKKKIKKQTIRIELTNPNVFDKIQKIIKSKKRIQVSEWEVLEALAAGAKNGEFYINAIRYDDYERSTFVKYTTKMFIRTIEDLWELRPILDRGGK
jgi:hypothetical protein